MRLVALAATVLAVGGMTVADARAAETRTVTLNGLRITLDGGSGAVLRMEYPGPGKLVDTDLADAGLVDVAYPVETFEPLRLSARHAKGAAIEEAPGQVTIRIPRLGPSRPGFDVPGDVAATVVMRADPDGRSIVLTCTLENRSQRPVRQVIFPELRGLVPTAGPDHTILKSCGFGSAPFRELRRGEADVWYANDNTTVEHKSGGMFTDMWGRWLDLGGHGGGLSLFPRRWGWDPHPTVVTQLRQATDRLRLLYAHPGEVAPGATWTSGEWVLTPHRGGWANGIEPYREWVRAHLKRRYSMPRHIAEGLGFRTLWMCQNQPADPTDVVWRIADLPGLADEARDHGLREMVLWGLQPAFDASLPPPLPHLGTEQELLDAVRACRQRGVNVAPFISVLQASPKTADRYGLRVTDNNGWTYHTEMIPRWNPPYATGLSCVQVGPANQAWQDEVAASCARWLEKGLASVAWDQYWAGEARPTMQDLTARIRDAARRVDPESTFSGEELWNIEVDAEWLDYTWNWGAYRDCQAFVNAFPAPRPNVNIDRSPAQARFAFMDGLFLNVWPSKPDGINGSERIANVPELSRTLKVCAGLRARFLPYFTDGVYVGDCLLTQPWPGVRVAARTRPGAALAIVLNQGGKRQSLRCAFDLGLWVKSPSGRYTVTWYDEAGKLLGTRRVSGPVWSTRTPALAPLEMMVYEVTAVL